MLSRVAENLYWMSRYVERAENVARLMDDAFHLELEAGSFGDGELRPLESVVTILACRDACETHSGNSWRDEVLELLTFDRTNDISIRAMIARARENARSVQDTLSAEAFSQLNRFYLYLSGPKAAKSCQQTPFRFFDRIKRECALFAGLIDGTLPRTEVYHFLQVGKYLERVDMLSRILNVHCFAYASSLERFLMPSEAEAPTKLVHWMSLLRSCSADEAYLKHAHERIDPAGVVRFLILEPDFPRAIRFAVARCLESLRALSGGGPGYGSEPERRLGRLESDLRYMDLQEVLTRGISPFLVGLQDTCNLIGQDIQMAYFLN